MILCALIAPATSPAFRRRKLSGHSGPSGAARHASGQKGPITLAGSIVTPIRQTSASRRLGVGPCFEFGRGSNAGFIVCGCLGSPAVAGFDPKHLNLVARQDAQLNQARVCDTGQSRSVRSVRARSLAANLPTTSAEHSDKRAIRETQIGNR